ncbi:MAG: phage tail tube protein [Sphingomonas sp.]
MPQAQGMYKQLSYKAQSAKGTAASGSGGQLLRRETASFKMAKDTFESNEITSHQMSTGASYGVGKTDGTLSGVLSPATYADMIANVLRADFASTSAITGLSLTIAGAGPYTVTRGSGSFLTDGVKIGDVTRITAGTYTGTARDINLLVTNVTALVMTVIVVNGSTLTTQGPITGSTVTIVGKKCKAPLTGHTNVYYTFEEWNPDITRSTTYTDTQCGKVDIGLPSTGNATVSLSFMGLNRTKGSSQVLTSPTAETSTPILNATNGYIIIGGTRVLIATSMSISIDGTMTAGEATVGNKRITDNVKGDIKVTGSFTALYEDETIGSYFDDETPISIVMVVTDNASATSDFVTFVMSRVKVTSDDADDGKKQIVKTHSFTAEINGSGGAALANDKTIITIQDSAVA